MAVALMKVAGLYLRKSSEDERSAEDGKSVERQREHATAFAATRGWRVDPDLIFSDEAISGGEFKRRPGLARLLAALETKRFETLIVMDQSRLGRDTIRTLALIQAIQEAGVRIYGYLDGRAIAVDSEMGEVESFMKSWADAKVRRDGRQRVRDALVRKARLGHATGQRTYSYRLVRVGDHTEREVDPAQAAVVRRVFALAAEGYGDARITNLLAADHVSGPGARRVWSKNAVRRMLQNELYLGISVFGMTHSIDRHGSASQRERAPQSEWVRTPVPHLRIVDDAVWEQVQARRAKTRAHYLGAADGGLPAKPEAGIVARYLLSGIARCGVCGSAMTYMGRPRRKRYYYCIARAHRGPSFCSNRGGVPMRDLDEAVRRRLYDLLAGNGEAVAALCEELDRQLRAEQATRGDRREAALREAAQLEQEIGRLVSVLASGKESPAVL